MSRILRRKMNLKELLKLQENGWEIVSHSKSHMHLNFLNKKQIETELKKSKEILKNLGLNINNFVCPYNECNEISLNIIKEHYLSSCSLRGVNLSKIDKYKLKRINAEDTSLIDEYKNYIDIISRGSGWIIFYLHRINKKHIKMLEDLIGYIRDKKLKIVTINQAINLL